MKLRPLIGRRSICSCEMTLETTVFCGSTTGAMPATTINSCPPATLSCQSAVDHMAPKRQHDVVQAAQARIPAARPVRRSGRAAEPESRNGRPHPSSRCGCKLVSMFVAVTVAPGSTADVLIDDRSRQIGRRRAGLRGRGPGNCEAHHQSVAALEAIVACGVPLVVGRERAAL